MTTTTPRTPPRTACEDAYAAAQLKARTLLAELAMILDEHAEVRGERAWGHVTYVNEVAAALQRIVADSEE